MGSCLHAVDDEHEPAPHLSWATLALSGLPSSEAIHTAESGAEPERHDNHEQSDRAGSGQPSPSARRPVAIRHVLLLVTKPPARPRRQNRPSKQAKENRSASTEIRGPVPS